MTQHLADILGITDNKYAEPADAQSDEVASVSVIESTAMTLSDRVDVALPAVDDMGCHDSEMDDIAEKALSSYEDLIALGGQVSDKDAGKIFEVAATMLKTAMEAKEAKLNRKLRVVELQLKKLRIDKMGSNGSDEPGDTPQGIEFDRNELLRHLAAGRKLTNELGADNDKT